MIEVRQYYNRDGRKNLPLYRKFKVKDMKKILLYRMLARRFPPKQVGASICTVIKG